MKQEKSNTGLDREIDHLLKSALTPVEEPDELLNRKVLCQWKENKPMKKKNKKLPAAAAAACAVLAVTVSVGAVVRYQQADQIAEEMGYDDIAKAFQGENAIEIGETQEAGGYSFTLMGVTSGERLSASSEKAKDLVNPDDFYAVVAIEHSDGTPMPDTSEDAYAELAFFMSPLIQGLEPWNYNAASMGGGYTDMSDNGVIYRLVECDNVEYFADRQLYFAVIDETFIDNQHFIFDEETGEIASNPDYQGINLLFDLPLDESRADPEKAAAYLEGLGMGWNSDDEYNLPDDPESLETAMYEKLEDNESRIQAGGLDEVLSEYELVETITQPVEKDGSGCYMFTTDEAIYYFGGDEDFVDGRQYIQFRNYYDRKLSIYILQLNGDDTITLSIYELSFSQ